MRKDVKYMIISACLLSVCLMGCAESEEQIIVETLPPAVSIQGTAPETDISPTEPPETQEVTQEESTISIEYASLLSNFEFSDCVNMIVSPDNPLNLVSGAPEGYAIGKPFRLVVVHNGVDGFDVEAGETWQFPVIASGNQIIGMISAYRSIDADGNAEWKHFSATQGIAPELNTALAEYDAFALFMDGTDDTHSGIIYGITPKNKTITIAQNSAELVALLQMGEEEAPETTEDPILAQRISTVHKLRGERETQPFQTLKYHSVWGFDNTVSNKLFDEFVYTSPDYTKEAPSTEPPSESETTDENT
ncbi:MAG TPA: hypothetical protein DCO72_02950 [Ruminococcus sp.]|nr:hypothetical protein [Ruminococcus sp.]